MLFFPILFILLGFQLIVSPILLWGAVPQRWHVALALAYAAIGAFVMALWLRNFVRERRAIGLHPAAGAHWRWSARAPPELFRRKIDTYLAMQGWRVAKSAVTAAGRVELVLQKERLTLALLCVGPHEAAGPDDLIQLQNAGAAAHALFAALVTASPASPHALAAVHSRNLLLLRYPDLQNLDDVMYQAAYRFTPERS